MEQKLLFAGLDQDTADFLLEEGSYRDAENFRVGSSEDAELGNGENIKGNTRIEHNVALVDQIIQNAVGWVEDKKDNSIVYFIRMITGQMMICRYYPEETSSPLRILFINQPITFGSPGDGIVQIDQGDYITGTTIVDNVLYWTDGRYEPRQIDLGKADYVGRKKCYEVIFPDYETGEHDAFVNGDQFILSVYSITSFVTNTILNATAILTADGTYINDYETAKSLLMGAVNAHPILSQHYEAILVDGKVMLCEKVISTLDGGFFGTFLSPTKPQSPFNALASFTPSNFFPENRHSDELMSIAKAPPVDPPQVIAKVDTTVPYNYINRSIFFFQYRYVFDDGKESAWSPMSSIPTENIGPTGNIISSYNYLLVKMPIFYRPESNNWYRQRTNLSIIDRIEIGMREHNGGELRIVGSIPRWRLGYDYAYFRFYNNGNYVATDQSNADKLYDSVPVKALSLESSGGNRSAEERIFMGGTTEGYDNVAVDASVDLEFEEHGEQLGTYTITGKIILINPNDSNSHQAVHQSINNEYPVFGGLGADYVNSVDTSYQQILPEGGWPVYLAGTDHVAISKQVEAAGVDYYDKEKNIYDSETPTLRTVIGDALADETVWSEFSISGVKPGKYVLRVGSHWCSYGDKLGKGEMYDLGNGIRFQETSSYVAGTSELIPGKKEFTLDLPVIGVGTTTTVVAGDFFIHDLTDPDIGQTSKVYAGYLLDAGGEGDRAALRSRGERMPLKTVEMDIFNSATTVIPNTDHNGFFFGSGTHAGKIRVLGISGFPIKEYGDWGWIGGLQDIQSDTGTLTQATKFGVTGDFNELILFCKSSSYSRDYRTYIEGRVVRVDNPSIGISSASVVVSQGAFAVTKEDGYYKIIIYSAGTNTTRSGNIYIGNASVGEFASVNTPPVISFTAALGPSNFNDITTYDAGNYLMTVYENPFRKTWKLGDTIQFGIVYYDKWNRSGAVNTSDDLIVRIPGWGESITPQSWLTHIPKLTWTINHTPPDWATHFQWVRTKGQVYRNYLQVPVSEVKFIHNQGVETGLEDETTYGSGLDNEVWLSLSMLSNYNRLHADAKTGYQWVEGDRLRLIRREDGSLYDELVDVPIVNQVGDYIVVKNTHPLLQLKRGCLIEIYTPMKNSEEKVYYEFSQKEYIYHYGSTSRVHGGTIIQGSIGGAAMGDFANTGNTYRIARKMPTEGTGMLKAFWVESPSLSDFFISNDECIGRPNVVDHNAKQQFRETHIRFSDRYIPNTKVNGLSSFQALNGTTLPVEYGPINKLVFVDNVMLAICKNESVSIYLGESELRDLAGTRLVAISNEIIGQWRTLAGGYGTAFPESVAEHNGRVYFFDQRKGKALRYSNDGLTPISDYKMSTYFRRVGKAMGAGGSVIGGIDPLHDEYIISFAESYSEGQQSGALLETIAFSEGLNRWITRYSYIPELIGKTGQYLVTWKDGKLYIHNNDTENRNTYYGIHYPTRVHTVSNMEPSASKVWRAVSIETVLADSAEVWSMEYLRNELGQQSRLDGGNFRYVEGAYYADILRDEFTQNVDFPILNGERIRSRMLYLHLYNNANKKISLTAVTVGANESPKTVK